MEGYSKYFIPLTSIPHDETIINDDDEIRHFVDKL